MASLKRENMSQPSGRPAGGMAAAGLVGTTVGTAEGRSVGDAMEGAGDVAPADGGAPEGGWVVAGPAQLASEAVTDRAITRPRPRRLVGIGHSLAVTRRRPQGEQGGRVAVRLWEWPTPPGDAQCTLCTMRRLW